MTYSECKPGARVSYVQRHSGCACRHNRPATIIERGDGWIAIVVDGSRRISRVLPKNLRRYTSP